MKPAVELPLWSIDFCTVQGRFFELAWRERYDMGDFVQRFMLSKIAEKLDGSYNRYQWSGEEYLLESFVAEYAPLRLKRANRVSPDALFWMGYAYRYWHFLTNENSRAIYKVADYERMRRVYAGYHTLSCEEAVDRLKVA